MSKTIAQGEITIIDLIDTATYIYYADDAEGTNPSAEPEGKKYIGIYSGPSFEGGQPLIPPEETIWSKYVGEDGPKGDKGDKGDSVTITSSSVQYAASENGIEHPTTGWSDVIPPLNQGEFLWIKTIIIYSDGKKVESYSISYFGIDGTNGNDANTYYIETNEEEILRFYESNKYSYSPGLFTFKIYENPKQTDSPQIEMTNNSFKLEIQEQDGFEEIEKNESYLRLGFIEDSADDNDISNDTVFDPNTVYFNLNQYYENKEILPQNSQVIRFSYLIEGKIAAIKIVQMRNGVSEEMAKFNTYAAGINASIQSGRLSFSANGLQMYKGDTQVFWADGEGDLWLKGNLDAAGGTFSGELQAASGSFSGEIIANSGTIGGLTISESALFSGQDLDNSTLKIYGNGRIEAENIQLGDKATIKNSITLGTGEGVNKVYIRDPKENGGVFLESGKITLDNRGILKAGAITLYGGDGSYGSAYITSGTEETGSYWKIKDDGTAQFREITTDKITVQNSVMEIGKIQAVGSIMFFKDSWKVKSVNGYNCELELTLRDKDNNLLPPPLKVGDYILANGNNYYQIKAIDSNNIIILDRPCSFSKGDIITKIGQAGDYLITVQGDSNQDFAHSTKNSLTLSSVLQEADAENSSTDIPGYEKKLVLGDLTSLNPSYGTGLYAENVFLNGTLTTKVNSGKYAGVNTLTGVNSIKFPKEDESKIVFWAGSVDTTADAIQNSKFQVTEAGSIYANQGLFEGSLITNSVIKGASIHTAKIYGENIEGGQAALQIFDANRGIQFIKTEGSEEIQLGISSDGLYTKNDNIFIKLDQGIEYFGSQATYSDSNSILFIKPSSIGFDSAIDSLKPTWEIKMNSGFIFTNNENSIFEIKNDLIKSSQKVNFEQNVVFGEGNNAGTLDYQKTSDGYYNLYVR